MQNSPIITTFPSFPCRSGWGRCLRSQLFWEGQVWKSCVRKEAGHRARSFPTLITVDTARSELSWVYTFYFESYLPDQALGFARPTMWLWKLFLNLSLGSVLQPSQHFSNISRLSTPYRLQFGRVFRCLTEALGLYCVTGGIGEGLEKFLLRWKKEMIRKI